MKLNGHVRTIALVFLLMAVFPVHAAPSTMPEPGFDTMVMIQRRPLNPTHVYTYHVEGLEKGGGLYVKSLADGSLKRLVDAAEGVILGSQLCLGGRPSIADARPAEKLEEPDWGNHDGFSLDRVVQPVLNKNRVSCHDGNTEPDLSGDRTDYFNVAYENLARRGTQAEHGGDARGGMAGFGRNPYMSWIPTFNGCESNILQIAPKTWGSPVSPLADLVINGHPEKNPFLAIPLARRIFTSKEDPDYQRILECFKDVSKSLDQRIDVDFRTVLGANLKEPRHSCREPMRCEFLFDCKVPLPFMKTMDEAPEVCRRQTAAP